MRNRYVVIPILIHIFVMLGLFVAVIVSGANYRNIMLVGDNYYDIAEEFAHGESLLHKFRGPVLPLIYSVLFVFPQNTHPFIRLVISLLFSSANVILLFRITKPYISEKAFLYGSLVFLLNPVYMHWTFRPYPEVFLAFFLGLLVLNTIDYYKTSDIRYLVCALIVFSVSFFIKAVFTFIPVFLFIAAIFLKSKKIAILSLLLLILGLVSYGVQEKITRLEHFSNKSTLVRLYPYKHQILLITDSYWVDYVLRTKQFHDPSIHEYDIEYRNGSTLEECVNDWIDKFYQRYPEGHLMLMNLYFVYDKPLLFLQKLIMSPLFFFSMSARTGETFIKLVLNFFSIVLSAVGLRTVLKNAKSKGEIVLIIAVILGFMSLHFVTHSMNRYSLPILPYLYIWAGIPLLELRNRLRALLDHER